MVYLSADCEGGGTKFPRLERPQDGKWCDFIECSENREGRQEEDDEGKGVVVKPKKGAAVFWENFRPDGRGYEETWHAGLPVKSGVKIGLNIWSWWQPGYAEALEKAEKPNEEGEEENATG